MWQPHIARAAHKLDTLPKVTQSDRTTLLAMKPRTIHARMLLATCVGSSDKRITEMLRARLTRKHEVLA